ncbi:unnamed protein product [Hymenolepis diminuta]|uniref:Intraflagellar transport protein 74 homolog n=3 Tax=Hymenolepis diminuta TaxID=6216 RepID=A0A0R3SFA3_HYMDI|nr:unnamed protein product [Hymenolepis diminuta]
MRPSGSKRPPASAGILPVGTATRLTTGLPRNQRLNQRHLGTPTVLGSSVLNTELTVEDRPKTGVLGIKSTTPKSSLQFRRQIEDRSYYIGLLREHINAITAELKILIMEYSNAEEEARSFGQYEKMAENLAAELKDLQGELGDYNTLIDKATLGHDISSFELDWEDLKAANDRAEVSLEHHFEERKKKEAQLMSVQLELEQEKCIAECIIEGMNDEQKAKYIKLRDQNNCFLQEISFGQSKLSEMLERRRELEVEISTSDIKQEALLILSKLRDVEAKRDQLQADEDNRKDPQFEKERLLAKIKEDNLEITNMEREIRALNKKIRTDEVLLYQLITQLSDEPVHGRNQKIMELKRREAQIDDPFSSYEFTITEESENLKSTEDQIVKALERCSQHIVNIEQLIGMKAAFGTDVNSLEAIGDQVNFKWKELSKSANSAEALNVERLKLINDLRKTVQLEIKMAEELETLKTKITSMESDLERFNDIFSSNETSEEKNASLMKELENLKETRKNLDSLTTQLEAQYTAMEDNLNSNETHVQLCALEKKLIACEERKHALSEAIETKKSACDFSFIAMKAKTLVADYNEALKTALKRV